MKTEIYWIDLPGPGRLAIMPRPRGDDWLEGEIESLKGVGVQSLVSMLTAGLGFLFAALPSRRSLADRLSSTRCIAA